MGLVRFLNAIDAKIKVLLRYGRDYPKVGMPSATRFRDKFRIFKKIGNVKRHAYLGGRLNYRRYFYSKYRWSAEDHMYVRRMFYLTKNRLYKKKLNDINGVSDESFKYGKVLFVNIVNFIFFFVRHYLVCILVLMYTNIEI